MRPSGLSAALVATVLVCTLCAPAAGLAETATDPAATPAPVLLVRSFVTSPHDVLLGQRFTLTLTIRNETKPKALDVVVALGGTSAGSTGEAADGQASSGSDLVSLDASDVRFVGDMAGGASVTVAFDLISSPRASAGVFSLPVNISSNVDGIRVQSSQNIGLVIGRAASFTEQNVEFPATATLDEQFPISLDVVNTSTYAVPAVTLRLEGDAFTLQDASILVGTVEIGDSGTLEAKATPTQTGDATLTVVAAYRDDFGLIREVRFPHKVRVSGKPQAEPDEDTGAKRGEQPQGFLATVLSFFSGLLGLGG